MDPGEGGRGGGGEESPPLYFVQPLLCLSNVNQGMAYWWHKSMELKDIPVHLPPVSKQSVVFHVEPHSVGLGGAGVYFR